LQATGLTFLQYIKKKRREERKKEKRRRTMMMILSSLILLCSVEQICSFSLSSCAKFTSVMSLRMMEENFKPNLEPSFDKYLRKKDTDSSMDDDPKVGVYLASSTIIELSVLLQY
jgi:ABC-type phosphate transport system permease subunit